MFTGWNNKTNEDDIVYILINSHWEKQYIKMPDLPKGLEWKIAVNTAMISGNDFMEQVDEMIKDDKKVELELRSVLILLGVKSVL